MRRTLRTLWLGRRSPTRAMCVMDDEVMKIGLLMEAAQSLQTLAESTVRQLDLHTQDLETVVRSEVRRVFTEELQALAVESQHAITGLRAVRRAASIHFGVSGLCVIAIATLIPIGVGWMILPSRSEVALLRTRHDELSSTIKRLEKEGGKIDLRPCGHPERLCVHVDKHAAVYGETADYFVVSGY